MKQQTMRRDRIKELQSNCNWSLQTCKSSGDRTAPPATICESCILRKPYGE